MAETKTKPEIRFAEFVGSWERRALGEMGSTLTGLTGKTKDDFGHGDGEFVTYMNVFSNPIAAADGTESVEIDDKQIEVNYGDVFFTTSSETPEDVGMSSIWLENKKNVYLNSFCFGWRPTFQIDPYYLAFALRSPTMRRKFVFLAQGISRYNISKNKVMEIRLPLPRPEEQQSVGQLFAALDGLIVLRQQEYGKAINIKKAMLEKMFPKDGEDKPEIRFAGFSGAWTRQKLSKLADFSKGQGYSKRDLAQAGTPIILYGRLYTNYETIISEVDTFVREKDKSIFSKGGEVIVPASGETAEDISRASVVKNKGIILGGDLNIIRPYSNIDPSFLAITISSGVQQKELSKRAQGKSIVHIHNSDLQEVWLLFPTLDEQKKIRSFFDGLDRLISLHGRELEKHRNLKKALLDRMFV